MKKRPPFSGVGVFDKVSEQLIAGPFKYKTKKLVSEISRNRAVEIRPFPVPKQLCLLPESVAGFRAHKTFGYARFVVWNAINRQQGRG